MGSCSSAPIASTPLTTSTSSSQEREDINACDSCLCCVSYRRKATSPSAESPRKSTRHGSQGDSSTASTNESERVRSQDRIRAKARVRLSNPQVQAATTSTTTTAILTTSVPVYVNTNAIAISEQTVSSSYSSSHVVMMEDLPVTTVHPTSHQSSLDDRDDERRSHDVQMDPFQRSEPQPQAVHSQELLCVSSASPSSPLPRSKNLLNIECRSGSPLGRACESMEAAERSNKPMHPLAVESIPHESVVDVAAEARVVATTTSVPLLQRSSVSAQQSGLHPPDFTSHNDEGSTGSRSDSSMFNPLDVTQVDQRDAQRTARPSSSSRGNELTASTDILGDAPLQEVEQSLSSESLIKSNPSTTSSARSGRPPINPASQTGRGGGERHNPKAMDDGSFSFDNTSDQFTSLQTSGTPQLSLQQQQLNLQHQAAIQRLNLLAGDEYCGLIPFERIATSASFENNLLSSQQPLPCPPPGDAVLALPNSQFGSLESKTEHGSGRSPVSILPKRGAFEDSTNLSSAHTISGSYVPPSHSPSSQNLQQQQQSVGGTASAPLRKASQAEMPLPLLSLLEGIEDLGDSQESSHGGGGKRKGQQGGGGLVISSNFNSSKGERSGSFGEERSHQGLASIVLLGRPAPSPQPPSSTTDNNSNKDARRRLVINASGMSRSDLNFGELNDSPSMSNRSQGGGNNNSRPLAAGGKQPSSKPSSLSAMTPPPHMSSSRKDCPLDAPSPQEGGANSSPPLLPIHLQSPSHDSSLASGMKSEPTPSARINSSFTASPGVSPNVSPRRHPYQPQPINPFCQNALGIPRTGAQAEAVTTPQPSGKARHASFIEVSDVSPAAADDTALAAPQMFSPSSSRHNRQLSLGGASTSSGAAPSSALQLLQLTSIAHTSQTSQSNSIRVVLASASMGALPTATPHSATVQGPRAADSHRVFQFPSSNNNRDAQHDDTHSVTNSSYCEQTPRRLKSVGSFHLESYGVPSTTHSLGRDALGDSLATPTVGAQRLRQSSTASAAMGTAGKETSMPDVGLPLAPQQAALALPHVTSVGDECITTFTIHKQLVYAGAEASCSESEAGEYGSMRSLSTSFGGTSKGPLPPNSNPSDSGTSRNGSAGPSYHQQPLLGKQISQFTALYQVPQL